MIDLERIEKLVAEATPGRWFTGCMNDCVFVITRPPRGNTDYAPHGGDPETEVISKVGPSRIDEANAAFIASAKSDVPALVAEVKRLREALMPFSLAAHALADSTKDGEIVGLIQPPTGAALGLINAEHLRRAREASKGER